ncbi:hypothetical protein ACFO9Q_00115 [Paenibacillus sp. GCM10023252]|uniref:hypothetical protein n=1 Tax=Paenibacillus sp. GCM10023252 TaxID=3252649 RepID=UPI00361C5B14
MIDYGNLCKRAIAYMLLCLMAAGIWLQGAGAIQAAPEEPKPRLQMEAEVSYNGMTKDQEWYPVRLTVTNNTDKDLKGEIVLSALSPFDGTTTDYAVEAELPKHTPMTYTLALPGIQLNKDTNEVNFYQGSKKSGTRIPILNSQGQSYLESNPLSSNTIGVISRDPDTLNFLPALNQRGYNVSIIPIKEEQLPESAVLLDSFQTIVINDTATSSWSERQVKAINGWVQGGGTLVLAGGAGYDKTARAFESITPVKPGGTASLTSASTLSLAGGKPLELNSTVTLSKGDTAADGQILLAEGGIPLAVSKPMGKGTVLYVAFDPSLEPLASWSGSPMLWAKLLKNNLSALPSGLNNNQLFYGLQNIIDYFPSIQPPDFKLLLVIFIIYMIIVAPVLYVILAKRDKREWAWWLIPAVSVITGIVIFYFGADDKRQILAHNIQVVELTGRGDGVRTGAIGVFMPQGGTVEVKYKDEKSLISYGSNQGRMGGGGVDLAGLTKVSSQKDAAQITWQGVPYWSTRKAWVTSEPIGDQAGSFLIKSRKVQGDYEVTVTNETNHHLKHVHVVMSGQVYSIGELDKQESGVVKLPAAAAPLSNNGYYPLGYMIFPNNNQPNGSFINTNDEAHRERELLDQYYQNMMNNSRNNSGISPNSPQIIAFSYDHEPMYEVNGKEVRSDNLTMWTQKLEYLTDGKQETVLPFGTVTPVITEQGATRVDYHGDGAMYATKGELQFEYNLPSTSTVQYKELTVHIDSASQQQNLTWSIWSAQKQQWVDVPVDPGKVAPYLVEGMVIRMKVTINNDTDLRLPQISLRGDVKSE